MDSIDNVSALCWDCIHCESHGERMVGSHESGGPEEFVSCNKGRNQFHLKLHGMVCRDHETY